MARWARVSLDGGIEGGRVGSLEVRKRGGNLGLRARAHTYTDRMTSFEDYRVPGNIHAEIVIGLIVQLSSNSRYNLPM